MASLRAPFNTTLVYGTYVGGTPPFFPLGTTIARVVNNPYFDFAWPFFRHCPLYITAPITFPSAAPAFGLVGNIVTINYNNVTRFNGGTLPAGDWRLMMALICDADPGNKYWRMYVAKEPVVL